MLTGHKIESVAEKHFGSEYGASGYKRVTLPALINFVGEILAAHSAGAQAKPRAWLVTAKSGYVKTVWTEKASDERMQIASFDGDMITPLYAHPQPMPQTDAARDVLTRAKRMLEGYADSYDSMSRDSTSRGGDGRISCIAVMYDIRDNMAGWCDAEIERLDGAKGE